MTVNSVIVVGGGIAGVSTVGALRAGGFEGDVSVIDAGEFPYDRPPLSKDYLSGALDFKNLALQPAHWYDDQQVRLIGSARVAALRCGEGSVELDDGRVLAADRVVLATGGTAARPPIPGGDSRRVHVLRTAEDADRLRAALLPNARILIVGAGLIGAEVASTAAALGCTVVLADPVDPPLAAAFGTEVADWLHGLHAQRGITVVRAAAQCFDDDGGRILAKLTGQDAPQPFDAVLLAVGMAPDVTLAESAGLRTDRGIIVDDRQSTSNPAVFAVGDAARTCSQGVLMARTEHWEAAQHDGQRAAAAILQTAPPAPTASWFWTDRHDVHVEVVGTTALADAVITRGTLGESVFSLFGLRDNRICGAVCVNDPTAARAARRLIDRGIDVDREALGDPKTDLRKLVRGGTEGKQR